MDITAVVSATRIYKCMENRLEEYIPNTVFIFGIGARVVGRENSA